MKHFLAMVIIGSLFLNGLYAQDIEVTKNQLQSSFTLLTSKSFKDKTAAISTIADSGNPLAETVLSSLLKGNVYYHKESKDIFIISETASKTFHVENPITENFSSVKTKKELRKKYKKVGINNKIRGLLKEKIATLTIYSSNKDIRLSATRNILKNLNPSSVEVLRNAVQKEQNSTVKQLMNVCIAVFDAKSNDPEIQLALDLYILRCVIFFKN